MAQGLNDFLYWLLPGMCKLSGESRICGCLSPDWARVPFVADSSKLKHFLSLYGSSPDDFLL
jgi:hypothetical protein